MGHPQRGPSASELKAWRSQRDDDQRRLDEAVPPIERPCGTPGAVYTMLAEGSDIGCIVRLPFTLDEALPPEALDDLKKALHDAMLPLVERFYRDVWKDTLAGRRVDGAKLPKTWTGLFFKWLDTCVKRGERQVFDGRRVDRFYVEDLKRAALTNPQEDRHG